MKIGWKNFHELYNFQDKNRSGKVPKTKTAFVTELPANLVLDFLLSPVKVVFGHISIFNEEKKLWIFGSTPHPLLLATIGKGLATSCPLYSVTGGGDRS
jgi:hypothetical protein